MATRRNCSPSKSNMLPKLAPQMRTAFSSMAANSGCRSPAELEITWSTSEVAVCCSSYFPQFARALLFGLEQPHILDGDHCLMSEGFDNGDLSIGEWFDFGVVERDHPQQISPLQYRHRKEAAVGLDSFRWIFVVWVGQHVGDINRSPLKRGTAGDGLVVELWIGFRSNHSFTSAETLWVAVARSSPPSRRKKNARSAAQRRAELSTTASNTAWRSKAERLMTSSTLEVAVCCASASSSSRLSRPTSRSGSTAPAGRGRSAFAVLRRLSDADLPRPPV